MKSTEFTIRANREEIDDAIVAGTERAQENFTHALSLAQNSEWAWGTHASLDDYRGTNPLLHQLTGELPIGVTGYRDEEYNRCNDSISKELYPDFAAQVLEKTKIYIAEAREAQSREERLIKLDFAKQYALTMFHAVQYPMRTDYFEEDELSPIDRAGEAARLLTRSFYLDILGHDVSTIEAGVNEAQAILEESEVESAIHAANKKHFKMQELDQPLTILASSLLAVEQYPETDIVYALPAGGTQHGMVTQLLHELRYGTEPQLEYLPISTHSTGKQALSGDISGSVDVVVQRSNPHAKNVLICEDNSNTGTTLALATDVVAASSPTSLHVSIVEFDPRRLEVKNRHPEPITNIANFHHPDFTTGVGIVPVTTGKYPDLQMRKIMSLRRRLPQRSEAHYEYDTSLEYSDISDAFYEDFYTAYKGALRYCGDMYGYRNPYLVSAVLLRHYIERGMIPESTYEDYSDSVLTMSHAGTNYPYMPSELKSQLATKGETLDYDQESGWMRAGVRECMGELLAYSEEVNTKVHIWTKGDASFYSNPPFVGMEEQSIRYRLSGLQNTLEEIGFTSSGRGEFVAHPKKTHLLKTKLLPDLMRFNSEIKDVVVLDDSEKNLAEAAQAIRLYGLRPHIINPLSRETGRSQLDVIADLARKREWGENVTFIVDMDDTLLHEGFRKFHQPRNIALALLDRYPHLQNI